jgi:hypothetical protein
MLKVVRLWDAYLAGDRNRVRHLIAELDAERCDEGGLWWRQYDEIKALIGASEPEARGSSEAA